MNAYNPLEDRDYIPIADHAVYVGLLFALDNLVILSQNWKSEDCCSHQLGWFR